MLDCGEYDLGYDQWHRRNQAPHANLPTMQNTEDSTRKADCSSIDPARGRRVAAIVLLVFAAVALGKDYLPFNWRDAMLALLGIGFVVWAGLARSSGLLVPGGVLIGIGVGIMLRGYFGAPAFLFAMAGGFLLISVLSLAMFGRDKNTWWTLFPAGGLAFAGLVQVAGSDMRTWIRSAGQFLPYLAIVVALGLLFWKPTAKG